MKKTPNIGNNGIWHGDSWKRADDGPPETIQLSRAQQQIKANTDFVERRISLEEWRAISQRLSEADFAGNPLVPKK